MRPLFFIIIFYFTQIIISQTNNYSMKKFGREFKDIDINGKQAQYLDGFLLVKLKDGFTKVDLEEELRDYSFSIHKDYFNSKGWGLLEFSQAQDILNVKSELSNLPSVKLIDLNYKIDLFSTYPNDPYFYYQWSLHNLEGNSIATINAPEAWDITKGSSSILIGIIDSGIPTEPDGITLNHEDLDNPSVIDVPNSASFILESYPDWNNICDGKGHGSHVAGIILAEHNNTNGISGIAPNCKAIIIKAFSVSHQTTEYEITEAVEHAIDKDVRIVNMSWGGLILSGNIV